MENLNKKNVFFFILFLGWLMASGQTTIWSEDFESYTNGTQTGNGTGTSTASWSTNDTDVSVQTSSGSQVLRGQNTDNTTAYWTTGTINISGFINVSFSLDAGSGGTLDSGQDVFRIQYRIDGGSYVEIENTSGDTSPSEPIQPSYSVSGLSGNTLEFRITMYNTGGTELYEIDNILVQGTAPGASNDPPVINATGDQDFCPGTPISVVETISITDSDDTTADEVSVQISSGYINGEDLLTLTGSHPSITASWSAVEGKLTLTGPATFTAFESAVSAVQFSTSGTNPSGSRSFSITVGDTNFLPATGHYYEFVSDVGIRWTDARDAAALRTYYGLQGYLATLTSQEESDFSGSQAQGVGWIGASDAATEGDWRWVTGPEAGTPFWSGTASGSTTPPFNFAYWNGGEPNQSGNEDYAHITDPSVVRGTGGPGSWNDLRDQGGGGAYRPQGYVVEYGGTTGDPVINVTAVTTIDIDNVAPTWTTPVGSLDVSYQCADDVPELPSCTDLSTTFFNEAQFSWGFGVQNSTGSTVDYWEARIINANYQIDETQLSNQSLFTYVEVDNGDGTYNHIFQGTNAVAPFSGIGGNIEWSGVNFGFAPSSNGIQLFCGTQPFPFPVASDNCSADVAIVSDITTPGGNPNDYTRVISYQATDGSGNTSAIFTRTITVADTTDPTASNPSAITVECIGDVPLPNVGVVTDESDNCSASGDIVVAFVSDSGLVGSNPGTITRTYSVTDEAGNSITVTQNIIVDDTTDPTASDPSDITVECIGDVPLPNVGVVTDESDNCSAAGDIVVAFVSDSALVGSNPGTITRTYSVTDEAGNSITVTQDIIVDDTTDPTASDPSDITVECIGDVPLPNVGVVTDESDNCSASGDIVVAFVSDSALTGSNPGTITRTYSVTDEAGNSITVTQDIIVDDTTDPTASDPSDITIECIGDVPLPNVGVVTDESDNCSASGDIVVAFVSDSALTGSNPGTITRTYSVTDEAGNSITVTQDIIVDDTTDPTASDPSDITVECIGDVPLPNVGVVTDESDNCSASGDIVVAFVSDSALTGSNPGTITRTY
uniref:C-type lectin domain-containing protein n=1 Tax=Flagellimonas sp. HSM57 TaxID=2654675 RepID=UPI0013D64748